MTKGFIEDAQLAKSAYGNPQLFEVVKLNEEINTEQSPTTLTYSPELSQLFYTVDGDNNSPQLLTVSKNEGIWSTPQTIPSVILTDNNIDFEYLNPQELLFKHDDKELNYLRFQNNKWSVAESYDYSLPVKNTKSHFTISKDEKRVIFSEKDFLGYYDLYETINDGGKWSKPQFITNVNSPSNEQSPFLLDDGNTLYFSSDGHNSNGGYDVYVSTKDSLKWSNPINLGYPINSFDDELHFSPNSDGKSGYFLSDRLNSNGGHDIYYFNELQFGNIEGVIVDNSSGKIVPDLRIEFHPTNFPTENFISHTNAMGRYQSQIIAGDNIEVSIFSNENIVHQEIISVTKTKKDKLRQDFKVSIDLSKNPSLAQALVNNDNSQVNDTGYSPLNFIANKFRPGKKAMLKNLYFKFGSSQLAEGSDEVVKILISLMTDNPDLEIEIAGHADGVGLSGFNMWLSKKRAVAIYEYLTTMGVDGKRLLIKGYGETRPIATNDDEINGRSLNRRIEIIVAE